MTILLAIILTWTAIELIRYICSLISWGRETLPPPNINDILQTHYKPEHCDAKIREDCEKMLQQYFKEPANLPLYQRIDEKMKTMNVEQRKEMLRELTTKIADIMQIKLDGIIFDDNQCMGYYDPQKNCIMISVPYIQQDECNVEVVKTIFHELKHAIQFKAISQGGNIWGYSDATLIAWANNWQEYIRPELDPESYMTQPLEVDAFGFECSVIPQPGMGITSKRFFV